MGVELAKKINFCFRDFLIRPTRFRAAEAGKNGNPESRFFANSEFRADIPKPSRSQRRIALPRTSPGSRDEVPMTDDASPFKGGTSPKGVVRGALGPAGPCGVRQVVRKTVGALGISCYKVI